MNNVQSIKQRFGLIGNSDLFNRALEKAIRVAPTDISVLVSGESGVGKESIPRIIHHLSHRKHNAYIAVNCGAIPEGTIDSELFGHEKGAFTGATAHRKGYFEEAHKGTIFLDEVVELPQATQVRLLRVLETGEFIKVGSSKILKTDVRIVAATNESMLKAVEKGKFREDLYYRLNTVEINIPPLRDRVEDVNLLFRKFAVDFAEKYHKQPIILSDEAQMVLQKYRWPGNIRQLRNLAEQMSVLENDKAITVEVLQQYLPQVTQSNLPVPAQREQSPSDWIKEREILYKIVLELRKELDDVKKLTLEMMKGKDQQTFAEDNSKLMKRVFEEGMTEEDIMPLHPSKPERTFTSEYKFGQQTAADEEIFEEVEESLSLEENEKELIRKALERNTNKRKAAAKELGISERTLYRKIKQYEL
ncbi:MAG: sigma-54-dependent Fis family transcriptional regulator [Cryomorphaceae bacterium]|nr:sigma-54-dependent Fis family transcriptional regulator [Cryomorphaceae bacterium]